MLATLRNMSGSCQHMEKSKGAEMRTKTIWQILLSFLRFVLAAYAFYLAIDFTGMLRYLVIAIGISLIVMVVEDTQKEE